MKIHVRDVPPRAAWALQQAGVHPLLAQLYAARGVRTADELDEGLARLLSPTTLLGAKQAAVLLADAIAAGKHICIALSSVVFELGLFDTRLALILTYPTFLIPFCTWLLMGCGRH